MKFTLSALPTAMMTVALMSGPIVTYASTGSDNIESSDDMTPVTVTKIVDADGQINNQINNQTAQTAMAPSHTLAETHAEHSALNTLIDPITHKAVDNSYPLEVSSFFSSIVIIFFIFFLKSKHNVIIYIYIYIYTKSCILWSQKNLIIKL